MITREEIRQLAQLESPATCAISFYFQPQTPPDQSHREEAILVKDLVRECLRRAERNGNHAGLREDLHKVLSVAEFLHGNHSRGKAIFACKERGIWKELNLPPRLGRSNITVNSRFHLKPLLTALSGPPRTCIVLVDRVKARIFELEDGELSHNPDLYFGDLPASGRSDGFRGYEAGHRERHVENEVMHHFKQFADSLDSLLRRDHFELLLVGCRDETWPEIAPHLHHEVKRRLVEKFLIDPGTATAQEVREHADRLLSSYMKTQEQLLLREVIGEAQRNGRGAVGLRHVLTALERQEVQRLLVSRDFEAEAVECLHCRHLDTRIVRTCAVCGRETREIKDVSDALVDLALRNGAEINFIDGDASLENAGRVGALLRFRADQSTPQKLAG